MIQFIPQISSAQMREANGLIRFSTYSITSEVIAQIIDSANIETVHHSRSRSREAMNVFRSLLVLMIISIVAYTLITILNHGWNLLPLFLGDLAAMTWSGQFNLDFSCFLVLSGLWIAWRHQFSPGGLALGLIGTVGGIMFLAPYLLFATFQADGNMAGLLLGNKRVAQ